MSGMFFIAMRMNHRIAGASCWLALLVGAAVGQEKVLLPNHYAIKLRIDPTARLYVGQQRVRWTNTGTRPETSLYFHLYPNLRADDETDEAASPRLNVERVRVKGRERPFVIVDRATSLRVPLWIAPGESVEVEIEFRGTFPEVDIEETTLLAHLVNQIDAVWRNRREQLSGRHLHFRSGDVVLLGACYPVLAARENNGWSRRVEASVGDFLHAEVADYEVEIESAPDAEIFTSGEEEAKGRFSGRSLRNFAILVGRGWQSEERSVGDLRLRSVFRHGRQRVGHRVLDAAAAAAHIYVQRFGELPFKSLKIVEAPLIAGFGHAEFSGLSVIASAFYVDFDAPQARVLPEMVREQRASFEESLEWTVAHAVAHQWWGTAVGSDPQRAPVLDEALAHWSALLYFEEVHGPERAALVAGDQLRGVYQLYRTFGGEDLPADRAARAYRNSLQYAAIVESKGALMFAALRRLLGEARFFAALRRYYHRHRQRIANLDDLRSAFMVEATSGQRAAVAQLFERWLEGRFGDEDVGAPSESLAATLGLPAANAKEKEAPNPFARLGKFFWRQITRIR